MKRVLLLCGFVFCLIGAGVFAFAPHIPTLLREGFPPPQWQDGGSYEEVAGGGFGDLGQSDGTPLTPRGAELFASSDGAALLVYQGGRLSHEIYADGVTRETRFGSYSMVKSLVGLLVLQAVAAGDLSRYQSITVTLGEGVPDLTVGELLSMTGGLAATGEAVKADRDEAYGLWGTLAQMHVYGPRHVSADIEVRPDWVGSFHYQSANTALLGLLLEELYGRPLTEQLSRAIWQPAGAAPALWRQYPQGDGTSAYCCLYARAVDWVLVGRYILSNGTADNPLLPHDMWRDWVLPELDGEVRRAGAYGDHMRHDVLDREGEAVTGPFAYAMGHLGQVMYLIPGEEAIVVRFGGAPQLLHSTLYEVLSP